MIDLKSIASQFELGGEVLDVAPLGAGLINDTYRVRVRGGTDAVLQCLNPHVFPDADAITANVAAVLDHVRRNWANCPQSASLQYPVLYKTHDGDHYWREPTGRAWRTYSWIGPSRTLNALSNPEQARAVGRALGAFHCAVSTLDPTRLPVTRAHFHDTPWYIQRYLDGPPERHSNEMATETAALIRARIAWALEAAEARLQLAPRVVHGDTKIDNFLFHSERDEVVGLIDLDTVQPGLIQFDLADCLRSGANPVGEDPPDPAAGGFDMGLARALLRGYFGAASGLWTDADRGYLFTAIALIPFELGVRFFADHLAGNRYFKVSDPQQNLRRARVQLRLVAQIERLRAQIERAIADCDD